MKIEKLDLSHLRADAHFEFMTDAGEAVKAAGPTESEQAAKPTPEPK